MAKKGIFVIILIVLLLIGFFIVKNLEKEILLYECQEITEPGTYLLAQNIDSTKSNCFVIKSDKVILDGQDHFIKGLGTNDLKGIYSNDVKNLVIKNLKIINYENGIYVLDSEHVNIINNSLLENLQGIYIENSHDNEVFENKIEKSRNVGIILENSNNNFISSNLIRYGSNPIFVQKSFNNLIKDNLYQDNIRLSIKLNRTSSVLNQDKPAKFKIILGEVTQCVKCSYKVELTPHENSFLYSKENDSIIGTFIPTRNGIYSLEITLIDSSDNEEYSKYVYLVNPEKIYVENYYLRGIDPVHGQPVSRGLYDQDSGSLSDKNPENDEERICSDWVQFFPDILPKYLFGVVKEINFSISYKSDNETVIGVQRFATYDSFQYSKNLSFNFSNDFVSRNLSFVLNWPINYYWEWYWQTIKLSSQHGNPVVKTYSQNPDRASFFYVYSNTPAIRSISSEDLVILAATMKENIPDTASILFRGEEDANLSIEMPNKNRVYKAVYNDVNCNVDNCFISKQENGVLDFNLKLTGKGHLEIIPV